MSFNVGASVLPAWYSPFVPVSTLLRAHGRNVERKDERNSDSRIVWRLYRFFGASGSGSVLVEHKKTCLASLSNLRRTHFEPEKHSPFDVSPAVPSHSTSGTWWNLVNVSMASQGSVGQGDQGTFKIPSRYRCCEYSIVGWHCFVVFFLWEHEVYGLNFLTWSVLYMRTSYEFLCIEQVRICIHSY